MCGIGFVADARGRSSRALIDAGLEALVNLQHRGASGSDGVTGDGAGMMLPVPHALLAGSGSEPARTGVAMIFGDPTHSCRALVTGACGAEGIAI
jgi:glutamate synthase domain-containing protein 1